MFIEKDQASSFCESWQSPWGEMLAMASKQGLCLLEFAWRKDLTQEIARTCDLFGKDMLPSGNAFVAQAKKETLQFFAGERQKFSVPLDIRGTQFQEKVWKSLLEIPYGKTQTYGQVATAMGKPKAIRAAASAIGQNRLAIAVPCHRVIGKNGKLTGYAGGLETKQKLLHLEKAL